jgi:hypothetical protein
MLHPNVAQAIQEIDAAVFNGDAFEEVEARAELLEYIERWQRRLAEPIITEADDADNEED